MSFGDVPTWIASIIAGISVFALLKSIKFSQELLAIEKSRDLQARKVSGWTGPSYTEATTQINLTQGGTRVFLPWVKSIIANDSDQPIYNVVVLWAKMPTNNPQDAISLGTCATDVIPPGGRYSEQLRNDCMSAIWNESDSASSYATVEQAQARSESLSNRVRVAITFTDTNGERWIRQLSGLLKKFE